MEQPGSLHELVSPTRSRENARTKQARRGGRSRVIRFSVKGTYRSYSMSYTPSNNHRSSATTAPPQPPLLRNRPAFPVQPPSLPRPRTPSASLPTHRRTCGRQRGGSRPACIVELTWSSSCIARRPALTWRTCRIKSHPQQLRDPSRASKTYIAHFPAL